jgi:hypothetical protein
MARGLAGAALGLATAACSVAGVRAGTEEPKFEVVERHGSFEVRRYGPRIAAEVNVAGPDERARGDGFRKLAAYIFGGNSGKASIAMTAPVDQTPASGTPAASGGADAWTIRFFMPSKFTLADLPAPKDPAVRLESVPGGDYAVLTFHGAWDAAAVRRRQGELASWLASTPWRAEGQPSAWFYDPPWTLPPLRRNEVAVRVTRGS